MAPMLEVHAPQSALSEIDNLRTLLAGIITQCLQHPRPLVIRAYLWLAANTQDIQGKRRCLNAVLELDPEDEPATPALLILDQTRPTSEITPHPTLPTPVLLAAIPLRPRSDGSGFPDGV